jgi:DNA repair exonuclease SbcCD ATPase subunit
MHLHLKNFRCYEDANFDFGEKGLVLLSGSSGKGKSTLLMAIDFALFGNGTKIVSHGKKSCSVTLQIGDLKIERKKGPNHLIVNNNYEDNAGEAIIQQKFGKIFNSVSYIPQNPKKSFVLMSAADRLEFLETFAFKDFDITNLKDRAKTIIKEANDTLSKTIGSFRFASQMLQEKTKPNFFPFPAKVSVENRMKFVSNEEVKLKNSIILIKKSEKKIIELNETLAKQSAFSIKMNERKLLFAKIENDCDDIQSKLDNVCFDGQENLTTLQNELNTILANKELISLSKTHHNNITKLEELMEKETAEMKEKIEEICSRLWADGSEQDIVEQIDIWECLLKLKVDIVPLEKELTQLPNRGDTKEELQTVKEKIKEKQKDIQIAKLEKESFSCPHCQKKVRFLSNTLVKTECEENNERKSVNELQNDLKTLLSEEKILLDMIEIQKKRKSLEERLVTLKSKVDELEDEPTDIMECQDSVKNLKEILRKNLDDEKILRVYEKNVKEKVFSQTISRIQKQVTEEEKKINVLSLTSTYSGNKTEDEVRIVIEKQRSEKERYDFLFSSLQKLNENKRNCLLEIEEFEKELQKTSSESEIRKSLKEYNELISSHTERKEKIEAFLKDVDKWKANEKEVLEYDKLRLNVDELQQKEIDDRKKYTSACSFRDNILEAESLYISNLIDNINNNVQIYLDHFFPDHPMTIRLTSFKETSKNETKPSINLEIDYKGIEMDLSMLSGGELSRVILSFTLAFADLYNSPLILLDECTSSLDQDLTSSVLEGLKENFGEKLTLIVAHQVVKGVFDKVIEL